MSALPKPAAKPGYFTITTLDELRDVIKRAYQIGGLSFDTETTGLNVMQDTLVGLSLAVEVGQGYYVPLAHVEGEQLPMDEVLAEVKPMLEDPLLIKVFHNAKFDLQMLLRYGIKLNAIEDTMLMAYSMFGGKHRMNMDDLAWDYLKIRTTKFKEVAGDGTFDLVPIDAATHYAAEDADITLRLYHEFMKRLEKDDDARQVYSYVDQPLITVVAGMEQAGVRVSKPALDELTSEYSKFRDDALTECEEILGHGFNPASPKQVVAALERLHVRCTEVTATGQTAQGKDVLEALLKNDYVSPEGKTFIRSILRWRKYAKLISTYTAALPKHIDPDTGRIHPSFGMAHTTTGRFACSDPNIQNQPSPNKDPVTGAEIRRTYVAEEGNKLIAADYSQIELRVLAEASQDAALIKAFKDGIDIHKATAAKILGKDPRDVSSVERRDAKAVNFGIVYGSTKWGLADNLGISPDAAQLIIDEYFKAFPGIRGYMDNAIGYARQHGYVTTMIGRKIWIPDIKSGQKWRREAAERATVNAPIQGTAADIIKAAMLQVSDKLQANFDTVMLMQVHDELVFEAPADEVEEVMPAIKTWMEGAVDYLNVDLLVDVQAGDNWAEAH